MKILVLSIITIVIISMINQSCITYNHIEGRETTRDTIITLKHNFDSTNEKIVFLYEDQNINVSTSLSIFKEKKQNEVNVYPDLSMDQQLLNAIIIKLKSQQSVKAYEFAKSMNLGGIILIRLAYHLENGDCMITKKSNGTKISNIRLQYYTYYCGELCGYFGRRFFIDDIMFFSTEDGIA